MTTPKDHLAHRHHVNDLLTQELDLQERYNALSRTANDLAIEMLDLGRQMASLRRQREDAEIAFMKQSGWSE